MEKLLLLLIAVLYLKAFALDSWVRIDCGANRSTVNYGIVWQTDGNFINTGINHQIPSEKIISPLPILNTLRAFTTQNKNCYTLPAQSNTRYFIRAVFNYANYDGLNNPPTFDLQIDGIKWINVNCSVTQVRYYEILYKSSRDMISVCVARTIAGQYPFITSLESWGDIPDSMYDQMNPDLGWLATYRYNYGTDTLIMGLGDDYIRVWEPVLTQPSAVNISADSDKHIYYWPDEHPPESAILDAMEAKNTTDSLFLLFNPVKAITTIYVEAYFTEMYSTAGTRSFDMYVNGIRIETVTPTFDTCTGVIAVTQSLSTNLTVELRRNTNSGEPPIISAIEVYTASDPIVTSGTIQDDLNGLEAFTSAFVQLRGWSGEPCLPQDTVWQWLHCTDSDPPRVTFINLSEYDLNGVLPDFGQMQGLEDIDLSYNILSGQIPEFLGSLPNLRTLNLSHNNFSGPLPSSIRDNKRLTYNIDGNPHVDASGMHKSHLSMILGFVIIGAFVVAISICCCKCKKNQYQPTIPQPVRPQDSFVTSASTEQFIRPPRPFVPAAPPAAGMEQFIRPPWPNEPMESTAEEYDDDCVSVFTVDTVPNEPSMAPEMDLEELEEEVNEYNETHASRQ